MHYTCILREFIVFKILKRQFLVAISQKVKHEFITNYSFPSERIKVIPNGVDVSKFKPEQLNRDLKQRLGIPFDKKIFIFVGNEFQRKGLKIILNGIAHCDKKSLENITLLIISRDNPDEYIKQAKKIGIYDICIFLGEIKDVSPYFNISDFAFLMSDYEPFGLVGIEAMASGNILLSTGVDGIADYLIDGENGYITPRTSEHVTHVVTQCLNLEVDVKNNMLINAYNTAQSYAWDKIALEYSEVISKYKRVLQMIKKMFLPLFTGGLLGKFAGVFRELLMAWCFGTGPETSSFRITQTVLLSPINLFSSDIISGGLIPKYRALVDNDNVSAKSLFGAVLVINITLALVLTLFLFFNRHNSFFLKRRRELF